MGGINQKPDEIDESEPAVTTATLHAPTPEQLTPFFPQLEILSLIGYGGMGAVYHARQLKLDRPVALKIILPQSAADPSFAERFSREARTLARLNHPNVVGIHDFGEFEQGYFFLMEYVAGANLRQILRNGSLEQGHSLSIVQQICEALQYAHDEGVVHRDIKPENILVDQVGRIKIADFGLARLNPYSNEHDEKQYFTLTGTNQVMGTPRYMAPEQIEASSRVDHRADIYSLGVVFYEMLTGEVPMGSFVPPSQKEAVDQRIDEVVLKAMAREPDRRYQQISSLANDINSIDPSVSPGFGAGNSLRTHDRFNVGHATNTSDFAGTVGISAMFDRDARAVAPWFANAFGPTIASSQKRAPILIITLFCILGAGLTLFPWLQTSFSSIAGSELPIDGELADGSFTNDVLQAHSTSGALSPLGQVALGSFGFAALLLLVTPIKRELPLALAVILCVVAAITTVSIAVYPMATVHSSPNVEAYKLASRALGPAYWGSLGCAVGVLFSGLIGVRYGIANRSANRVGQRHAAFVGKRPGFEVSPDAGFQGGTDLVTIYRQDVEQNHMPSLCMVCGEPSIACTNRTFEWQPKFFEELQKGNNPLSAFTKRKFRLPCPTCRKHQGQMTRFVLVCSTGWIFPVVLGACAGGVASLVDPRSQNLVNVLSSIGFLIPLAVWIALMIRLRLQQVRVISMDTDTITLDRVSWKFVKAFRDAKPSTQDHQR